MLLVTGVHRCREEHLNVGLCLVDSGGVHITLSLVLNVPLDPLLNFHDNFARQVRQQIDRLLLPAHTRVGLKEVRDVIVGGLSN